MFQASTNYGYDESLIDVNTGSDRVGLEINGSVYSTDPVNGFQSDAIPQFNQYDGVMEEVSVPSTGTSGTTSTDSYAAEFVLNSALDNNNERWAEFWIEVIDNNDASTHDQEIFAQIKCRMFQFGSGSRPGRMTPVLNQIPIGIVNVRRASDAGPIANPNLAIGFRAEQFVFDHCLRRYPIGYYSSSIDMGTDYRFTTGGMIFRGTWNNDDAWADTDLYNMAFYPGDVIQKYQPSTDPVKRGLYLYQIPPDYNVAEPDFGGNSTWKEIFYTEYAA